MSEVVREKTRLIIHVGFPKCGSTSLQRSVAHDTVKLKRLGIVHIGVGDTTFERDLIVYLEDKNKRRSEKLGEVIKIRIASAWNDAVERSAKAFLISFEPAIYNLDKFMKIIPQGLEIELALIVRDIDSWVQSEFLQQLKSLHVKAPVSFDKFLHKCIQSGYSDHRRFIQRAQKHQRISKLHILPLTSKNRVSITKRFYSEVLRVNIGPNNFRFQNQSISLDQAVILKSIRELTRSNLVCRAEEKSPIFRLGELVRSQECFPRTKVYFRSEGRKMIQEKSKEYSRWLTSKFQIEIDDLEISKANEINFDQVDGISAFGLRLLIKSVIQLWIEAWNSAEREYMFNFDTESLLFEHSDLLRRRRDSVELRSDFRKLDEILELLSAHSLADIQIRQQSFKCPRRRAQEILRAHTINRQLLTSDGPKSENLSSEGVSIQAVKFIVVLAAQVAWEILNSMDREWEVVFTSREFALAKDIQSNLAL